MKKMGTPKQYKKKRQGEEPDGSSRAVHNKNLRDEAERKRYPKPEHSANRFESDK